MLSLYLSLVVFQLGGFALPPVLQHLINSNVKRGPGVATFRPKLLNFSKLGFAYKLLKI